MIFRINFPINDIQEKISDFFFFEWRLRSSRMNDITEISIHISPSYISPVGSNTFLSIHDSAHTTVTTWLCPHTFVPRHVRAHTRLCPDMLVFNLIFFLINKRYQSEKSANRRNIKDMCIRICGVQLSNFPLYE